MNSLALATPTNKGLRQRMGTLIVVLLALVLGLTGCGSNGGKDDGKLKPGEYTVAVALSGGTGRAKVDTPTKLVVTAKDMTATVTWSSPNYTWMEVGGTKYNPVSAAGENSKFEIPVTLDTDIAISAETTAMSTPHTVEYTLRFDSTTVKAAG